MVLTREHFEKRLKQTFDNREFTNEECDELFQLYMKLVEFRDNLISTMHAVRSLIFIHTFVDKENIDYMKSFDIDYSSDIFSNEIIRKYNIDIIFDVLDLSMYEVLRESFLFFEAKDPVLWSVKLDFYKLKLKTICVENAYTSMIEIVSRLYAVLVKLNFDMKCPKKESMFLVNLLLKDNSLSDKLFGDNDGNYDDSFILSDFYFDDVEAQKIILDYESNQKIKVI